MISYRQMMEEEEREQEAERARAAQAAAPGSSVPAQVGEVHPVAEAEAYRPQPFTPDLVPEPLEVETTGDLTAQETEDLTLCERAFVHADQAEWMRGKAAHAVRSRRLYRCGGRLWPEYCEEVLGESESEVNRRIQQWPLARAISQFWKQPTPASHLQALIPAVEAYGEEQLARGYVELRKWATENGTRVTAADLTGWVKKARTAVKKKAAPPALTGQTLAQVREDLERQPVRAAVRKQLQEPRPKAAAGHAGSGPENDSSMLNHPNLGDSTLNEIGEVGAPAARGNEGRAIRAWSVLEGMAEGMITAGVLREASTATLKEIERTARGLADAAAEILKDR
ncbi:hypothetical protein ACIBEA_41370 [Streptomyces sp. NPDC051555]|uniref:hypothetical protein n=1 Tax=Streptomyces sp. NPDC051555 TaxID=3365657 RepID=UPI0037B3517D